MLSICYCSGSEIIDNGVNMLVGICFYKFVNFE